MQNYLNKYLSELWFLSTEMAPYLLLGFIFAGILHVYIKKEKITRYLGKTNFRSILTASLFGIPLPLCSCGVIPTGISFFKDGASKPSTVSFLISTPQTGVDSILVTWSLLGWPFAVLRPVFALFTGIFGGLFTSALTKREMQENIEPQTPDVEIKKPRWLSMLKYAFIEFMDDIAKWLLIGLLLAAAIAVIVPDDFFLQTLNDPILSMLLVLVSSIPLYVCATGSVPIAAVLLMKGLSPGTALVFLMAGPATNIATMTVIKKSLGKKTLLAYLISIIGGAMLFGLLIDLLLPASWFTYAVKSPEGAIHIIPHWVKTSSTILLLILVLYSILKRSPLIMRFRKAPVKSDGKTEYLVTGMTCNHCKNNIEKGVSGIEGVKSVKANINNGRLLIDGDDFDPEEVKKTIEQLGYGVKPEKK